MATYKIGQRVRILCAGMGVPFHIEGHPTPPPGKEGTVAVVECDGCIVDVDGIPPPAKYTRGWWVLNADLAPLTDPGADAFMERIKKLKPYDEPTVKRKEYSEGLEK